MSFLTRLLNPFAKRVPTPRDRYAGYNERVFAAIIDVSVLFMLLYEPFTWLSDAIFGQHSPAELVEDGVQLSALQAITLYLNSEAFLLALTNTLLQVIALGLVHTAIQHAFGTTLGRFIIGIKLVDATTEEPPTLMQYLRRMLGYFVSLPLFMVGFIWQCFDKRRQTWHDKIAGTVMLDMRPNGWYLQQLRYWVRRARGLPQPVIEAPAENSDAQQHVGESDLSEQSLALPENAVRDPAAQKSDSNT